MNRRLPVASYLTVILVLAYAIALPSPAPADSDEPAPVESVTVAIGNRLFPEFHEILQVRMHEKFQVGDTDYFFEIVEFYPHFAMLDSTKQVVSLSDEPENPAFKIVVYENDEVTDNTWAFFNISVPHFSRTSYLAFQVLEFDYRGEVFTKRIDKDKEEGQQQ